MKEDIDKDVGSLPRRYQAYLLRLWRVQQGPGFVWRVSLESPHTGERQSFVSLDALFAFLREKAESAERDSATAPRNDDATALT